MIGRRLTGLVLAVVFAVAACGAGGPSISLTADEQALADALVVEFESDPEFPFGADAGARCFAETLVSEFGVDRLAAIGITVDTIEDEPDFAAMSDAEIDRVADIAMDCVDYTAPFVDEFVDGGISRSSARCLADRLDEAGFFRATLISGLTGRDIPGEDTLFGAFIGAATACFTPEELADFMGG